MSEKNREVFGNFSDIKSAELVDGPGIGATYRENFELPSTAKKLPSKKGKPSTAKNLPSCCVTAVKI